MMILSSFHSSNDKSDNDSYYMNNMRVTVPINKHNNDLLQMCTINASESLLSSPQ